MNCIMGVIENAQVEKFVLVITMGYRIFDIIQGNEIVRES